MYQHAVYYFIIGIVFLSLAKFKNILKGYSTPRPFDISEAERWIEYDIHIVEKWLSHLKSYTSRDYSLVGKNILELGPGADLGIGIYLLSKGCLQYNACDVNDLIKYASDEFYEQLFEKLRMIDSQNTGTQSFLREELIKTRAAVPSRLNYVVRKDFALVSSFGASTIDLVFSQAAFEHFDDIDSTISQLSVVCKSGAVLIAEIDLKTHSRWIRDKDPNNIYRYPEWFYNIFRFRGIPNRCRPVHYKNALERYGWTDITITPLDKITDYPCTYTGLNKSFTDIKSQMNYLSIMICARKS